MRLKGYSDKDGRRVWLGREEMELFLSKAPDTIHRMALGLAGRCGLRSKELINVCPADVVKDDVVGPRVRVEEGKGDYYREVPMPSELETTITTYVEVSDMKPTEPIVDKHPRTIQRWVDDAAEICKEETDDPGWMFLGPHDLRRSWATMLVELGVEPGMIMEWGGWKDWETFREHYLGAYTPEMEKRQAALVPWLDASSSRAEPANHNAYTNLTQSGAHK